MVAIITRPTFCEAMLTSLIFSSRSPEMKEERSKFEPAAKFIRAEVNKSIENNPSLAGSILRLAFHDAVVRSTSTNPEVGGSDGSIRYELDWPENRGLSKPLSEIERIYKDQHDCKINDDEGCQILSFADVLALSGAQAVETAQGPQIPIKLGRKDKAEADKRYLDRMIRSESERSSINTSLPSPALDSLGLRIFFKRIGLTENEMVALMGAHDLGRHVTLTGMPKECLRYLTRSCLEDAPNLAPFVTMDPDTLSNNYFQVLLRWNDRKIEYGEASFIPTDVALVVDEGLKSVVVKFAKDETLFFQTFSKAYQKLVDSTANTSLRY